MKSHFNSMMVVALLVILALLALVAPVSAIDVWLSPPVKGNFGNRASADALCARSGYQSFAAVAYSGEPPISDRYVMGTNTRFQDAAVFSNGRLLAPTFTVFATGFLQGRMFTGSQSYWCNWQPNEDNTATVSFTGANHDCNGWTSAANDVIGKAGNEFYNFACGPPSVPPHDATGMFSGPSCATQIPVLCIGIPANQIVGAQIAVNATSGANEGSEFYGAVAIGLVVAALVT